MLTAYWGVAEAVKLVTPDKWQEWLLLCGYLLLFVTLLFRDRTNLQAFSWRKWLGWLGLGIAALVASLFLPVSVGFPPTPLFARAAEPATVYFLAAAPSLLAGIILGPAPALLVGMSTGLGRTLGQSYQLYDLFHYAFAAWIAASLMRLRYQGRTYGILRAPAFSGAFGFGLIAMMAAFVAFTASSGEPFLHRLDIALLSAQAQIMPLFVEGLIGGLMVGLILLAKPVWKRNEALRPSPAQRSVQSYLLTNTMLFGASVLIIVAISTFVVAATVSTRQVVAEMAAGAISTSARMTDFHAQMEYTLVANSGVEMMEGNKVDDRALGRIYRQAQHYDEVLFVDSEQRVAGAFPGGSLNSALTEKERAAVSKAVSKNTRSLVLSTGQNEVPKISLVVPVAGAPRNAPSALVGRIKESALTGILNDVTQIKRGSSGAIVNADGQLVAHVGVDGDPWSAANNPNAQPVSELIDYGGNALISKNSSGARQLIYVAPWDSGSMKIVVSVPFANVLSQAFGLMAPLALVLLVVAGLFTTRLANYGRNLSASIFDLTRSSREIAARGLPNAQLDIDVDRTDELGELSRAFIDMQRGVKQRFDEQSLLLSVSREISSSIDLAESIPAVLQGVVRGTGAAGARALVLSPTRGRPLEFSEGPASEGMKVFDRPLLSILRANDEIAMESPRIIREYLEMSDHPDLPAKALYAIQLQRNGQFLGFITIGFRQSRAIGETDQKLMQTFARQAAALIEKSYLFTNAESGRRRLVAVLESTAEAVIVTDQTSRILIINRALEQAFNIESKHVVGRLVGHVINTPALVNALSGNESDTRMLEISAENGRTYFANTSIIVSHEGQALGRVAVLHDVTDLKAIDRLKSEFVDNVSHDLRTPLTILSGYASALSLLDDLTAEQRAYSDNIMRSVEQMIRLVDNLLDIGRIEAGVELDFVETDIGQLLKDSAEEHWLFAHESGIRLHVRVEADLPEVCCDSRLIGQAVANLLMNGFKYAPDSGDMTLAAEQTDGDVVISVRDRGPGIDKKDQMRLFEKFYRVKRHGSKVKGSGLGLAMVKSIAERHGGNAWCFSEAGKGSTFYISLPIERDAAG